jgi:hypothetical protein
VVVVLGFLGFLGGRIMSEKLAARLAEMVKGSRGQFGVQKWTFSLEAGRGETYSHSRPVLYGHSTYKRGSVMAGRPLRQWVETWDSWEEARADLASVKKAVKGFKFSDHGPEGGSSHVPIDVLTAGLPDEDY